MVGRGADEGRSILSEEERVFGVGIKVFLKHIRFTVLHPQAKRTCGGRNGKPPFFDRKFIFHSWSIYPLSCQFVECSFNCFMNSLGGLQSVDTYIFYGKTPTSLAGVFEWDPF